MTGALLADPNKNEEKADQARGDEQKQKKKSRGANRPIALVRLFPSSALLHQFHLEQSR
jgi:hypothetical protein